MGQDASRPERASADQQRSRRSEPGSLRRILHNRHLGASSTNGSQDGRDDGLDDGLLNTELRQQRQQQRPRPESTNRLSQIWRPVHSESTAHQQQAVDLPRAGPLQRTRSRFQHMWRRDSNHHSRSTHSFLQHNRLSYARSRHGSSHGDDLMPRLPSIDLSSTFDHDTFGTQPSESDPPPPRSEHTNRRPSRFNSLRPVRHLTHSLRRRRSPPTSVSSLLPRGNEDQATMLSRLLSAAALATAETLMGNDPTLLSEATSLTGTTGLGDLGGSGEDGSFDGFLRALQNGRIASALRQGGAENTTEGSEAQGPPLNFFRMFRFGASAPSNEEPRDSAVDDASDASIGGEGRLVPIIIVGIRSISSNANSGAGSPTADLPPFIDALGNFSRSLPANALGTQGHESIDSILRPPQNGTSFRHRRRASMGGFGMGRSRLSDRMDDQRDHRSPDRRRERPWSMASASSNYEPRPPPATPASPSPELSRISSRNSTPSHSRPASIVANSMRDFSSESRRNSALHRASVANPLSSHTEETASLHSAHSGTGLLGDSEPYRFHRRSDTAPNIHYPRFASGHPRRNGVVEPDNLPALSRSSTYENVTTYEDVEEGFGLNDNENRHDSRSWIIYVLGGSYPENHPIVTTPSLFTENPTYEDMMLLSALLGPAKAPVATEEDVQGAGGLYTIEYADMSDDATKTATLVAAAVEGDEQVTIDSDQRCLVCLCDFEAKEVARKLVKCNHLFHKDCIDQWLTTGRNSCPLCREQGVDEKTKAESEAASAESTSSAASTSGDNEMTIGGAENNQEEVDQIGS